MTPSQRFTPTRRCPVCNGHARLPAGHGERCWGFLSEDGMYAHCAREDRAGGILAGPDSMFAHRLKGSCKCGVEHGAGIENTPPEKLHAPAHRAVQVGETVYRVGDFEHVRREFDDGSKLFVWRGADGSPGLSGTPIAKLPLYGVERLAQ